MDAPGLDEVPGLFLIDLSSRRVEIAGVGQPADGLWMSQIARNLRDAADGFLTGKRYLILDRDRRFTAEFMETLEAAGVKSLQRPARAPKFECPCRTLREND